MRPDCPRCGYDQSGVIDSWKESCPLTGTCSECGLDFAWRDVLNLAYSVHLHLFEHAKAHLLQSWWRTVKKTRRPGRFWTWMRIEYEVRPARLAWFAATGFPAMYILAACFTTALYIGVGVANVLDVPYYRWAPAAANLRAGLPYVLIPSLWSDACGVARVWMPIAPLMLLFMPLAYLLLPRTFRRVRVRRRHLLRIWIYSLVGFASFWHLALWIAVACLLVAVQTPLNGEPLWAGMIMVTLPVLWIVWWWYRASRDYLRLPTPGFVTVMLSALAFAAAWLVMALVALAMPAISIGNAIYW
ncbi:MAG: hypothetical protein IT436_08265 [Phycisphaerales bacterium]|nr:hypothetical protein [Phycisphaerales bacterium]